MNRIVFDPKNTRKVLVYESKKINEQLKEKDNGQNQLSGKR